MTISIVKVGASKSVNRVGIECKVFRCYSKAYIPREGVRVIVRYVSRKTSEQL